VAAESSVVLLMLPDLPQVEEVRRTLHPPPTTRHDSGRNPGAASGSQERVRHGIKRAIANVPPRHRTSGPLRLRKAVPSSVRLGRHNFVVAVTLGSSAS
jgi:hypothetical protein